MSGRETHEQREQGTHEREVITTNGTVSTRGAEVQHEDSEHVGTHPGASPSARAPHDDRRGGLSYLEPCPGI